MKVEFNLDEIDNMLNFINQYMNKVIESADVIAKRLVDIGVETAKANVIPEYASNVFFTVEEDRKQTKDITRVKYTISGQDIPIFQEWINGSGHVDGYEISPLLLSEFGSGWLSDVKFDGMQGIVGQGTMPNSKGHAFDQMGWGWYDLNGQYHRSIGVRPTYPIYKARMAMLDKSQDVIDQVLYRELK